MTGIWLSQSQDIGEILYERFIDNTQQNYSLFNQFSGGAIRLVDPRTFQGTMLRKYHVKMPTNFVALNGRDPTANDQKITTRTLTSLELDAVKVAFSSDEISFNQTQVDWTRFSSSRDYQDFASELLGAMMLRGTQETVEWAIRLAKAGVEVNNNAVKTVKYDQLDERIIPFILSVFGDQSSKIRTIIMNSQLWNKIQIAYYNRGLKAEVPKNMFGFQIYPSLLNGITVIVTDVIPTGGAAPWNLPTNESFILALAEDAVTLTGYDNLFIGRRQDFSVQNYPVYLSYQYQQTLELRNLKAVTPRQTPVTDKEQLANSAYWSQAEKSVKLGLGVMLKVTDCPTLSSITFDEFIKTPDAPAGVIAGVGRSLTEEVAKAGKK